MTRHFVQADRPLVPHGYEGEVVGPTRLAWSSAQEHAVLVLRPALAALVHLAVFAVVFRAQRFGRVGQDKVFPLLGGGFPREGAGSLRLGLGLACYYTELGRELGRRSIIASISSKLLPRVSGTHAATKMSEITQSTPYRKKR